MLEMPTWSTVLSAATPETARLIAMALSHFSIAQEHQVTAEALLQVQKELPESSSAHSVLGLLLSAVPATV